MGLIDFLWQILRHVLPTGFRRLRDYGFLHANANRLLTLLQIVLRVIIPPTAVRAATYPGLDKPVKYRSAVNRKKLF